MWALVAAFAAAAGLVGLAATRKPRRAYMDRRELAWLATKLEDGSLTLDQAEDGLVLARHHGRADLVAAFSRVVGSKKKSSRR